MSQRTTGQSKKKWLDMCDARVHVAIIRTKKPAGAPKAGTLAADGRTRWRRGGKKTVYSGRQFWWSRHQVGFKELLDTRGKDDVASPLGEWTRVECICNQDRITIKIEGVTVNECLDVYPSGGRILLQSEGNEIYFRKFELHPLNKGKRPSTS